MKNTGWPHAGQDATDDWITPKWILDALGPFDLDPCASMGQPWPTAATMWDQAKGGLLREWCGRVWCNPPYAKAGLWLGRMAAHGNGIALVFSRTETDGWYRHVWGAADGLIFLRGRLDFCLPFSGRPGQYTAGAGSALIAYGADNWSRLQASLMDGARLPIPRDTVPKPETVQESLL